MIDNSHSNPVSHSLSRSTGLPIGDEMIELHDIAFAYGRGQMLLQNMNCGFARGRLTALLGPNGCGKSTLLKLAAGLLSPASGEVLLAGRPLNQYKPREVARYVSLLGQLGRQSELTVRQLAELGRYPHCAWGGLRAEDRRSVVQALELAGVVELGDRRLSTLSGGQLQRAYIALALAQDADVVLLDEPTAWLDISARFEIMQLLRQLCADGKTVAVVMHELDLALEFADELLLLEGGRLRAAGRPDELAADGSIEQLFGIVMQSCGSADRRFWAFASRQAGNNR